MLIRATTVLFVCFVMQSLSVASVVYYDDEAEFLAAVPFALSMESFETLPVDTTFWARDMVSVADFDVIAPTYSLSVGDTPVGGIVPIDGNIYVRNTNNPSMTFAFDEQQTAFGHPTENTQ